MLAISRMKALISTYSVPHISKTAPLSFLSKSIQFNPPTPFKNPNHLHLKPLIFVPRASISSEIAQNRAIEMEAASRKRSGEIHVIVGPMFAGKTTTLLRKIQSERSDGRFDSPPILSLFFFGSVASVFVGSHYHATSCIMDVIVFIPKMNNLVGFRSGYFVMTFVLCG